MKYAEIIPLLKLPRTTGTFTYQVPPEKEGLICKGIFVEIPFRKRKVTGMVSEMHNKKPPYKNIAPISRILEEIPSWTEAHISALHKSAKTFFSSPATLASGFTPSIPKKEREWKAREEEASLLPRQVINKESVSIINEIIKSPRQNNLIKFQKHSERLLFYRQIAGSTDKQILILSPQHAEALEIFNFMKTYFSDIVLWDNSASKNRQWKDWQSIRDGQERVIISTRSGCLLPCRNLGAVILDQHENDDHKSWESSPFYDARIIAEILAREAGIPCFMTSLCPKTKTACEYEPNILKSRSAEFSTVYHKRSKPPLHQTVLNEIDNSLKAKKAPLIVMTHRSKSRTLRCLDCHNQWRCQDCLTNLAVRENNLVCPNCGRRFPLPAECPACASQRIREFGLGAEGIKKTLESFFSGKAVELLNSENQKIESPEIIVSTGFIFKRILAGSKVQLGPIILYQPESLLFTPDYRANEIFYRFLSWHRSTADEYFNSPLIIQTALNENDEVYSLVKEDSYLQFLEREKKQRQQFAYPPFADLYSISYRKTDEDFKPHVEQIAESLKDLPDIISAQGPNLIYKNGQITRAKWLIKVSPDKELTLDKSLKSLYSKVTIDRNPA